MSQCQSQCMWMQQRHYLNLNRNSETTQKFEKLYDNNKKEQTFNKLSMSCTGT